MLGAAGPGGLPAMGSLVGSVMSSEGCAASGPKWSRLVSAYAARGAGATAGVSRHGGVQSSAPTIVVVDATMVVDGVVLVVLEAVVVEGATLVEVVVGTVDTDCVVGATLERKPPHAANRTTMTTTMRCTATTVAALSDSQQSRSSRRASYPRVAHLALIVSSGTLVLANCASASKAGATSRPAPPSTSVVATSASTATTSASTSASASASTVTTQVSTSVPLQTWNLARLTISSTSLGDVHVGTALADAQAAAGVTFDGHGDGFYYPRSLPSGYAHDFVGFDGNVVSCVGTEIWEPTVPLAQHVSTPEGVGLGDPVSHLLTVYGSTATYVPAPGAGMTNNAGYVVGAPSGRLAFVVYEDKVTAISGGPAVTPNSCTG